MNDVAGIQWNASVARRQHRCAQFPADIRPDHARPMILCALDAEQRPPTRAMPGIRARDERMPPACKPSGGKWRQCRKRRTVVAMRPEDGVVVERDVPP